MGKRCGHCIKDTGCSPSSFRDRSAWQQVGANVMNDEILAIVEATPIRRWLGVSMMAGLGGIVIYIALVSPPDLGWQLFLLVVGVLALWMADRMRRATEHRIELTQGGLRTGEGQVIAEVDNIERVDRGMFVFKPSNGFLVRLIRPEPRIWRPGLWWCSGRRIGVGGVTSAGQTKAMSEILSAMLAERDQARQDRANSGQDGH